MFTSKKDNAVITVQILLKYMGVKVTLSSIEKKLTDHPEYPSLLSISDCLLEWGVPNQAYKIDLADFQPEDLYFPFIAHFPEKGGRYLLVTKIASNEVYYEDEIENNGKMSLEDFLKRWKGVALHGTPNVINGELNYRENRIKEFLQKSIYPLASISLIILFFLIYSNGPFNLSAFVLGIIKVVGLSVSILILIQSLNSNNAFVANLCKLGTGGSDCNSILKSDAAKVTSWLSWSEVGLFYFSGTLLTLLWLPSSIHLLAWINVLALPYIFYSLGYQFKHQKWCVFCCVIQGLLATEFVTNLFFSNLSSLIVPGNREVVIIFLAFISPILIWFTLKPLFINVLELSPVKNQLKKFKYNSELFDQALKNQPCYAVPDSISPILLGNKDASTVITMVSNPFCEPCAKAHQVLDDWLRYKEDIAVKLIFTSYNSEHDQKAKISRHLSALSKIDNKALLEEALNNWYGSNEKSYDSWATKYPADVTEEFSIITQRQRDWCDLVDVQFTPTILLNGYKLPVPYRLEDIKYLI